MDKHYNFCVLKEHNGTTKVILFNETLVKHKMQAEIGIRDVDVEINEHGLLYIKGKEDVFEFSPYEKIHVEDLDERPEEKFIQKYNGLKIFGKWIFKPFEYVRGWYGWYGKKDANYILKNYNIEILD